jgi:outer membrane protein
MVASGLAILATAPATAETLESALAKAYQGNPSLNASRAGVRAIDENVAIAQSGYRPQVNVGAAIGVQYLQTTGSSTVSSAGGSGSAAATAAGTSGAGSALGGAAGPPRESAPAVPVAGA